MTKEELKQQSDERIANAKAAQGLLNARIAELKTCEGKTYIRKGSDGSQTIKVIRYEGIGNLANGQKAHLFRVEKKNPGSVWTPPATQFLEEHEEVPTPVTQTDLKNEVV